MLNLEVLKMLQVCTIKASTETSSTCITTTSALTYTSSKKGHIELLNLLPSVVIFSSHSTQPLTTRNYHYSPSLIARSIQLCRSYYLLLGGGHVWTRLLLGFNLQNYIILDLTIFTCVEAFYQLDKNNRSS